MKRRKRELTAALLIRAVFLSAALLLIGCPGDPAETTVEPPPPGGTEPPQYEIRFRDVPENGEIVIDPTSRRAPKDATVKITLNPASGYEPYDLVVFDTGNHPIPVSPPLISSNYVYTFTMPATPVWVGVYFYTVTHVVELDNAKISSANSWEEIDALNRLIKMAPNPNVTEISDAIKKLSGVKNTASSFDAQKNNLYESPGSLGVIRTKMRYADLRPWIALNYPPGGIEKGTDIFLFNGTSTTAPPSPPTTDYLDYATGSTTGTAGDPITDTLGTDLTYLFYVKENNPNLAPLVTPGNGWQAGGMAGINESTLLNLVNHLDGIIEIPLIYEVGINDQFPVNYRIWLWPVAQYTLLHEPGAFGDVILEEYEYVSSGGSSSWTTAPITRILSEGNPTIGNVGRVDTPPASPPNPPNNRDVYVEISTVRPNVLISIYTSSGSLVRDVKNIPLNDIKAGVPGQFYPESRQYIIRVRPSTPPTGM